MISRLPDVSFYGNVTMMPSRPDARLDGLKAEVERNPVFFRWTHKKTA